MAPATRTTLSTDKCDGPPDALVRALVGADISPSASRST